jgi:2-dehydropantoate 2-reductase
MSKDNEPIQSAAEKRTRIQHLSFLCFGVGAIGTYIGGSLALSGNRVVFIEKPELAEEVRNNGLHLRLNEEERSVTNPEVVISLDEAMQAGPFDAIILAVKSFDTQSVINQLLPFRVVLPPIICLQNGVENEPALSSAFGTEKVIHASVTSAIGRRGIGNIVLERKRGIGISAVHSLSPRLFAAFNEAGLNARLYHHPDAMKWSKMLTNLIANASSAILDMTPAEIFSSPDLYRLELAQLRECLAVMKAQGIGVVDLPGTPVLALSWAIRFLPPVLSQPLLKKSVGSGRGGKMPSFHIDLHHGRGSSEVDYLNGAVVRSGNQFEVKTPVNQALTETLLGLTRGDLEIPDFAHQPEKLFAVVQEKTHSDTRQFQPGPADGGNGKRSL